MSCARMIEPFRVLFRMRRVTTLIPGRRQSWGSTDGGTGFQFAPFVGFVVLALLGQTLLVLSFNFAAASNVAVFHYTGIVFSTIIGYFAFEEFPTLVTWVGILTVVGCGLFIAWREHKARDTTRSGAA